MLFVGLYALFAVSAFAVIWLGWTLMDRDRSQHDHLRQQELDRQAEQHVLTLRTYVAETSERVARWAQAANPSPIATESVMLLAGAREIRVHPADRLLYLPAQTNWSEPSPEIFRNLELLEFRRETVPRAEEAYRILARSAQAPVRAGALLRLGRLLASSARTAEALTTYGQLAAMMEIEVAGGPAALIARHARLRLLDAPRRRLEANVLRADLAGARWRLSRGQFEYFWSEVNSAGDPNVPAPDIRVAVGLSEAAYEGYRIAIGDGASQGQRSVWVADRPWFLLWRTGVGGRGVYISPASSTLQGTPGFLVSQRDADGRLVAGDVIDSRGATVRATVGTGLPWTITVAYDPRKGPTETRSFPVWILLTVMLAFFAAGTYFISRAIRREMDIARLQSEFVAAVSHEFRSPLTTIRSLSEMLNAGRTIDQNLPRYYETLFTESRRLERLVESLLDFGRSESGKRSLRIEELNALELVRNVVSGFAPSGRAIEIHGNSPVNIRGDREAVGVAVRNLVENAIRYSPAQEPVEITVGYGEGQVRIAVKDYGPGVKRDEQDAIFQKFVRGSAAASGNVRGTGIGLAMVRQIAEAHDGRICLESSLGKGSVFTLTLPAERKS